MSLQQRPSPVLYPRTSGKRQKVLAGGARRRSWGSPVAECRKQFDELLPVPDRLGSPGSGFFGTGREGFVSRGLFSVLPGTLPDLNRSPVARILAQLRARVAPRMPTAALGK